MSEGLQFRGGLLLIAGCFLVLLIRPGCTDEADLVTNLPGVNFPLHFRSYSGYLQVTSTRFLHYWLVESQSRPDVDPLVLWFNGGPGCSSMEGLLAEHGPYIVTTNGDLRKNDFSWNLYANMLYIEAPAGVGLSYVTDNDFHNEDDQVAEQNYQALLQFYLKFPRYVNRTLWITGESYAGYYIPTLARTILQHGDVPLHGIMIGNALSSYNLNDDSLLYFANYHGLLGESLWDKLLLSCCPNAARPTEICHFSQSTNIFCNKFRIEASSIIDYGLNVYNLYQPCYGGVEVKKMHYLDRSLLFRMDPTVSRIRNLKRLMRNQQTSLLGHKVNHDPPCTNSTAISTYLNDPQVRRALHIDPRLANVGFDICNDQIDMLYHTSYANMSAVYKFLIDAKLPRILLFNGDVDMACNFLGDEWFLESLGYPLTEERRPWFYLDEDLTRQVGGYTKSWSTAGITFATVRGSGHMVPEDRPAQALHLFRTFLSDLPL